MEGVHSRANSRPMHCTTLSPKRAIGIPLKGRCVQRKHRATNHTRRTRFLIVHGEPAGLMHASEFSTAVPNDGTRTMCYQACTADGATAANPCRVADDLQLTSCRSHPAAAVRATARGARLYINVGRSVKRPMHPIILPTTTRKALSFPAPASATETQHSRSEPSASHK